MPHSCKCCVNKNKQAFPVISVHLIRLSRSLRWHYLPCSPAFPLQPVEIRIHPFSFQRSPASPGQAAAVTGHISSTGWHPPFRLRRDRAKAPQRDANQSTISGTTNISYCVMRAPRPPGHGELSVSRTPALKKQRESDGSNEHFFM